MTAKLEPQEFARLAKLTVDNAKQQGQLKILAGAMRQLLDYDDQMIVVYNRQGFAAISKADATGQARALFGRTRHETSRRNAANLNS